MESENELIELIDFNWQCLLMTRAIFNYKNFGKIDDYTSPGMYSNYGIKVKVNWIKKGKFDNTYSTRKLQYWHNANFIIRINGLLEEYEIQTKENRDNNPVLKLIYILRNKIGAHQSGLKKPKKKYVKEVNDLFLEIGLKEMNEESITNYNLAIDSVLQKIVIQLKKMITEIYIKNSTQ